MRLWDEAEGAQRQRALPMSAGTAAVPILLHGVGNRHHLSQMFLDPNFGEPWQYQDQVVLGFSGLWAWGLRLCVLLNILFKIYCRHYEVILACGVLMFDTKLMVDYCNG